LTIDQSQYADARGLHLLFAAGKRPTLAAIKNFVDTQLAISISHDPSDSASLQLVSADSEGLPSGAEIRPKSRDDIWVELLREGLTFDLRGIAPGQSCEFPEVEHRFDLERAPGASRLEALLLEPGQHLIGGETSMPVVKGMIALARDLVHHFEDIVAIVWPPSKSAVEIDSKNRRPIALLDGGHTIATISSK